MSREPGRGLDDKLFKGAKWVDIGCCSRELRGGRWDNGSIFHNYAIRLRRNSVILSTTAFEFPCIYSIITFLDPVHGPSLAVSPFFTSPKDRKDLESAGCETSRVRLSHALYSMTAVHMFLGFLRAWIEKARELCLHFHYQVSVLHDLLILHDSNNR